MPRWCKHLSTTSAIRPSMERTRKWSLAFAALFAHGSPNGLELVAAALARPAAPSRLRIDPLCSSQCQTRVKSSRSRVCRSAQNCAPLAAIRHCSVSRFGTARPIHWPPFANPPVDDISFTRLHKMSGQMGQREGAGTECLRLIERRKHNSRECKCHRI